MKKALLDILFEERDAVRDIVKTQENIEFRKGQLEYIRTIFPDCDAKEADLLRLSREIVDLTELKIEYEAKLESIRHELACHIKRLTT